MVSRLCMADFGVCTEHLAYVWQSVFETSNLGGNCVPSNCGLSGMTCHI